MTAADQLAALPEPIQAQLLRIYRLAAGMSPTEKADARGFLGNFVLLAAIGQVPDEGIPIAEMVSAMALIVTVADQLATAGKEA